LRWLTSKVGFVRARSGNELALAFALSSFQVSLLVLLFAFALFQAGSFGDFDTASGVLIFLWLWLTSFYWTLVAVSNIGVEALQGDPLPMMLAEGIKRGAMNGMTFFVGLLIGVFVVVSLGLSDIGGDEVLSFLVFGLVYLMVGSIVAAIVGGALGFVFSVVYRILLAFARLVAGSEEAPPADDGPRYRRVRRRRQA
jgi:hypothetical protein